MFIWRPSVPTSNSSSGTVQTEWPDIRDGSIQCKYKWRVQESVEWNFGEVVRSFKALDLKNNLKLGLSPVGKMYFVSSLIQNAMTCLYGNQTTKFF